MIHITDGQSDQILDVITARHIIDNTHRQSLQDNLETFDFVTFADKRFSKHLHGLNRIVIPAEDTGYSELVVNEALKYRESTGLMCEVYTTASYLLLKKAKVIQPQTLSEYTPSAAVGWTLDGTEWRVGIIQGTGHRTIRIREHTNPFALLKTIAREFNLELRFRVEIDGNRIIGRFVDLLARVGIWQGREIELGKDLIGIRRTEKTDKIVTALLGVGPERDDGTRLEVLVEDNDALQRWGRRGEHLIEVYEPQSTRQDMTVQELRQYTRTELNKRINTLVEYETDIADLEHVPGMENKRIRFGDTIRIKDTKFAPPLYLEARVFEQERNIIDKSKKKIKLGDFTEYTEDEVQKVWRTLQEKIREKISHSDMSDYTYDKDTIDEKDIPGNQAKNRIDRDVGSYPIESTHGSEQKANEAQQNAIDYAEQRVYEAELEIESAKSRIEDAELEIARAQQDIADLDLELSNLEGIVNDLDMEQLSDGIFVSSGGDMYLEGKLITRQGGIFDGDILARNLTLAGDITAQNATITGTIIGSGAAFNQVDIENAVIINADIVDAVITGELVGATGTFVGTIEGGTIIQSGPDGSIILDDTGFHNLDIHGNRRISIVTDNDGHQGFSASLIYFEPETSPFAIGTGAHGLGDAFIGWIENPGWNAILTLSSPGGEISLDANDVFLSGSLNLRASGSTRMIDLGSGNRYSVFQDYNILYTYPNSGSAGVAIRNVGGELGNSYLMQWRNDGTWRVNRNAITTTTSSSNMRIFTGDNGEFSRIAIETSRRDAKKNITDLDVTKEDILALNPVVFQDKIEYEEKGEEARYYIGLIAEDVAESSLSELASYGERGEPVGVHYDRVGVALLSVVQKLIQENENINTKLNELEKIIGIKGEENSE